MIFRFARAYGAASRIMYRHFGGPAVSALSRQHTPTIVTLVLGVGVGAVGASAYGITSTKSYVKTTKPLLCKRKQDASTTLLDVIDGCNMKVVSRMQTRFKDNVTHEEAREIRKRAAYQAKEHIMYPINRDNEFDLRESGNIYYGVNSVNMAVSSSINTFSAFGDDSSVVRATCAEIYKTIREDEMSKGVKDETSRVGQWLVVRVLDQDIEICENENGETIKVINSVEISYYP